jgi:hypothetical protein
MNARLAHLLVRLYPRPWRERYGAEFQALLEDGPGDLRTLVNTVWSAVGEHALRARGREMDRPLVSFGVVIRRPTAFLPLAMSLTALAVVLGHAAVFGVVHEADEGAAAHLWQLLIAGQVPLVAFFAIKWLPRATRQTLLILAMLAGATLANFAAVFFLT